MKYTWNGLEKIYAPIKFRKNTPQDGVTINKSFSKIGGKNVRKVWQQVPPEYLEKRYKSLPRQMKAMIAAGGGHTKY